MTISPKLQSYFDNLPLNKRHLEIRLWELARNIDPMFINSFNIFRGKLLWIILEDPLNEPIVEEEIANIESKIIEWNWKYNIELWWSIVDTTH